MTVSDEKTHRPYQRVFAKRSPTYIKRVTYDALDPMKAPGKVKRFADMSDDEKAEMRRLYET